jgi:hypothetical protein
MMDVDERRAEFVAALTRLSKEHGFAIGGCGCCDSPWIEETKEDSRYAPVNGHYEYDHMLRWLPNKTEG